MKDASLECDTEYACDGLWGGALEELAAFCDMQEGQSVLLED